MYVLPESSACTICPEAQRRQSWDCIQQQTRTVLLCQIDIRRGWSRAWQYSRATTVAGTISPKGSDQRAEGLRRRAYRDYRRRRQPSAHISICCHEPDTVIRSGPSRKRPGEKIDLGILHFCLFVVFPYCLLQETSDKDHDYLLYQFNGLFLSEYIRKPIAIISPIKTTTTYPTA